MGHVYNIIGNPPKSLLGLELTEQLPQLTPDDIDKGTIDRYFVRQVNHASGEIVEVDNKTYTRLLSNALWNVIKITWRISGKLDDVLGPQTGNSPNRLYTGVLTANTIATNDAEKYMPGIKLKLPNPAQYWIGR